MHMKRTADRLFGERLSLVGAGAAGRNQMPVAAMAAAMGAATFGSASRTACESAPANSRPRTPAR